mgnify:CR=1 FL=1
MKKIFLFILLLLLNVNLFAARGWWDSFVIVNALGNGNVFYDLGASTMNQDFSGANLGVFTPSNYTLFLGGQIKTWKNGGSDITGVTVWYRIYPNGSPSGSFIGIPYTFQWNQGEVGAPVSLTNPGDQQWGTDEQGQNLGDDGINILQNSTLEEGAYTLEIYVEVFNNEGLLYDNNSGNNYSANFTVTEGSLPVELTSFAATTIGNTVKLSWNTATEINNYGFEVERKVGSLQSTVGNYEKIGFVNGNGNSNSPKDYSFVDDFAGKPAYRTGRYSYRLKQIDNDGQFEYSKTIEVDINGVKKYELTQNYPNPFNPTTSIQYAISGKQFVTLKIYNLLGREVATLVNENKEAGNYMVNFDASILPSGVYLYKLQAGEYTQTRKMTLIK